MPPVPDATTVTPNAPTGNTALANIPLDTTDHNQPPEEVTSPAAFDFDSIVSDDKPASYDKLPTNTGKPTTTKKPQKFSNPEPAPEEKSEEVVDDPSLDPEPKAEDKAKAKEDVKEEIEDQPDPAPEKKVNRTNLPPTRDYSKFDPEEVAVLKKCRNEQFAEVSGLIGKYKERLSGVEALEGKVGELSKALTERGVPPNYYDHPEAFTLTPEFKALQEQHNSLGFEQAHYQEALLNIEEGKPFTIIRGYDKQGNPVYSQPQEASAAAKVQIMGLMQRYAATDQDIRNKVAGMQATFKQTHETAAKAMTEELNKRVAALIPEIQPKKEQIDLFKGAIPAPFREHPSTNLAATLYAVLIQQAHVLAKYKEAEKTKAKVRQDVAEAAPDTRNLPRNGSSASATPGKTIKLPNGKVVPATFDIAEFGVDN